MSKTRRPQLSQRAKLIAFAVFVVVVVGLVAGLWAVQQQTLAANAAAAARYTPEPVAVEPAKELFNVTVIGDSFTAGSAMGGKDTANWTVVLGRSLSNDKRTVLFSAAGLGGSGYVEVGPTKKTFLDAAQGRIMAGNAEMVIFFGSINDIEHDPQAVRKAAAESYAAARKAAPKARLVVVGPAWPHLTRQEDIGAIRDVLRDAAKGAGATFVDPFEDGWFQGSAAALIGSDGTHPTNEGHAYMAKLLTPTIRGALGI